MTDTMMSPLLWTLVACQLAMGGFDVVFHHEITERLPWRPNASRELVLHAVRNFFYALLFITFAWLQPLGALAIVLLAILAAEIVITLWDFVEEDMTRRLPPTERVLHTLLAINYGAIMALIAPEIAAWATEPTGWRIVSYGWGSVILTAGAAGVLLFGLRDVYTSRRAAHLDAPATVAIADLMPGPRQGILVTGGTGLIGGALVRSLAEAGHDVTVLTRDMSGAARLPSRVRAITSLAHIPADAHIDAIVDLAGEPVAGGPWTSRRRRAVVASRLKTLTEIRSLVQRLETRPGVIVKASAVGYYGVQGHDMLTEADGAGPRREFAARSCAMVERAARTTAAGLGMRLVTLRIGLVLGRDGGLLARLLPVFDLGLGGPMGSGRHWMSWIALPDMVRLIAFAIANRDLEGAVNATAPAPVTNRDFSMALARQLGRPCLLAVPARPLVAVLGDFARELLVGGQRVLPAKASAQGFVFCHPVLGAALADALGARGAPGQAAAGGIKLPQAVPAE